MNTQALSVQDGVHHYVEAVRAALTDLAPEVADDLTEGLESDLTDWVADSPEGIAGLPTPAAYAAELRSAAGLPEGAVKSDPGRWWERDAWTPTVAAWRQAREEYPWVARFGDVADELRPVGWVLRGIVLAILAISVWDVHRGWILAVALAVVSVWAGRRRRRAGRWGRVVLAAASALAVIGAIPAYWSAAELANPQQAIDVQAYIGSGMYFQGEPIGNIYLYGADGSRLTNVRAFDGSGHPLNLSTQYLRPDGTALGTVSDQYGTAWANLLPVDIQVDGDPWGQVAGLGTAWDAPKVLPPLDIQTPTPGTTATPSGTPSPTAKAPGTPSPRATTTGTPNPTATK